MSQKRPHPPATTSDECELNAFVEAKALRESAIACSVADASVRLRRRAIVNHAKVQVEIGLDEWRELEDELAALEAITRPSRLRRKLP